jgi:cytochrome c-type biogenesis protein CcmF
MASFFGNLNLWLVLLFAIFQFINSFKKNNNFVFDFNKIAVNGLMLCSLLSFFSLIYCHIISDFSLINVFQNSHTTKPLFYKISGVWGNHEGSMLLWILVLNIFNYFIFKLYNKINFKFVSKALETQALIIIGFALFTLLTSNPFEQMEITPENGLGFNPILQDPALAIHPPLLYIGYVGFSAAFSLSIAALNLKNNENIFWYNYMKPIVVVAWTFLTIGITFGSIWAYYELGWGGWWFWDPVENASFMPWLLGTALMHSLITVEKKRYLQSWVLLLSILTFLLSVIGTFLVRSGILTSVHTFALDPSRGIYILFFITLLGSYALILFAIKSKKNLNKNYFSFFSKEGAILINNILMVMVCATVFLGTIYPLIIEALTGNKISVGEPYFNSTVIPIIMPAILIMGVGPILSWGENNKLKVLKKFILPILITIILTLLIFLYYRSFSLVGILGILLSIWIISNNLVLIFKNIKKNINGMIIAHLGFGILILGITGSSVWQKEKIVKMNIGNEIKIKNYSIVLKDIKEVKKENYLALQGNFYVYNEKKNIITKLYPENRFYPITNIFTTEVSIHTNLLRDLYIVLGEGNVNEGWVVRVYFNPLVIWIWIGALTIFLGGLFSININLKKIENYKNE